VSSMIDSSSWVTEFLGFINLDIIFYRVSIVSISAKISKLPPA
jgi:hypothetical protein